MKLTTIYSCSCPHWDALRDSYSTRQEEAQSQFQSCILRPSAKKGPNRTVRTKTTGQSESAPTLRTTDGSAKRGRFRTNRKQLNHHECY